MEISKETKLLGYARVRIDDDRFETAKILSDSTVWLDDGTVLTAPPEQIAYYLRMLEHAKREDALSEKAYGIMQAVSPSEVPYVDELDRMNPAQSTAKRNNNAIVQAQNKTPNAKTENSKPVNNKKPQRGAKNGKNSSQLPGVQNSQIYGKQNNPNVIAKPPQKVPVKDVGKDGKRKIPFGPIIVFVVIALAVALFATKWADGTIPQAIHDFRFPDNGAHTSVLATPSPSPEVTEEPTNSDSTAGNEETPEPTATPEETQNPSDKKPQGLDILLGEDGKIIGVVPKDKG